MVKAVFRNNMFIIQEKLNLSEEEIVELISDKSLLLTNFVALLA